MSKQKWNKTFDIGAFLECADEIVNKKDTDRAWAWNDCYAAFQSNNLDNDTRAKELFIYLANWGMLRNSFLMDCTWRVLREVISINNFKNLPAIPQNENQINSFVEDIDSLYGAINDQLKKTRTKVKGTEKNISNGLITKIILGTTGYTVAYDTYVRSALSMISHMKNAPKLTGAGGYTTNSVTSLYNFYFEHKDKFDKKLIEINTENRKNKLPEWTIMKLIDSCLWGYWNKNGNDFNDWKDKNKKTSSTK